MDIELYTQKAKEIGNLTHLDLSFLEGKIPTIFTCVEDDPQLALQTAVTTQKATFCLGCGENTLSRLADVFFGVFSHDRPKVFLSNNSNNSEYSDDYPINLLESSVTNQHGRLYLTPIPLPSTNMIYTYIKLENVTKALWMFYPDASLKRAYFRGYLNELSTDSHMVYTDSARIWPTTDSSYACDRKLNNN